jgi:hypothetical protein
MRLLSTDEQKQDRWNKNRARRLKDGPSQIWVTVITIRSFENIFPSHKIFVFHRYASTMYAWQFLEDHMLHSAQNSLLQTQVAMQQRTM